MPNVIYPLIHLNGTSSEELINLRCEVIDALHQAGSALARAAPNGRDYYIEPGRMDKAVEQHRRRIHDLQKLIVELQAEMDAIEQQTLERARISRA